MADSTTLGGYVFGDVRRRKALYKAYLHCAAKIISNEGGEITAYDGDRIMAYSLMGPKTLPQSGRP